MSSERYDIIVIGAGIFGVCSAYYLQKNNPEKRILLMDRLPAAGQGNTAMSAAAFRNMFSSETNQLLTDTSIDFFIHIHKELKIDLSLRLTGYLWLLSENRFNDASTKKWMKKMANANIQYKVLDKKELTKRSPELVQDFNKDEDAEVLGLESVSHGLYGSKCGVLDPSKLVEFYLNGFQKISKVKPRYNLEVESLILEPREKLDVPGEPFAWQDSFVGGVKTKSGELYANQVVVATGAWVNMLLDHVGIPSYVKSKKRQLFKIGVENKPKLSKLLFNKNYSNNGCLPFTITPKGVYIRPVSEESSFWVGYGDKIGREYRYAPEDTVFNAEHVYYEQSIYPVLSKYMPVFEDVHPDNMWAGAYGYSIDGIPYVYKSGGAIVVSGGSGSGIMKSDALGRIVDALYRDESKTELYGGVTFNTSDISVKNRNVEKEDVII